MMIALALPSAAALRAEEVLRRQSARPIPAGNAVAALVAGAGAAGMAVTRSPPAAMAYYMTFSTATYCLRRGLLHKWPAGGTRAGRSLGAAEVLRRHLEYEADWHLPRGSPLLGRLLHLAHVLCWLLVFQPLYPVLEACLYPFDLAAFWFYYPKARGSGLSSTRASCGAAASAATRRRSSDSTGTASSSTSGAPIRRPTRAATRRVLRATCRTLTCRSAACATGRGDSTRGA